METSTIETSTMETTNINNTKLTVDELIKIYFRTWIGELGNTQGQFIRRFKINGGNFSKFVRGINNINPAGERALRTWIHEDSIIISSKYKDATDSKYVFKSVTSLSLPKKLIAIQGLKWVVFCDGDQMADLLGDVKDESISQSLALCIFVRKDTVYSRPQVNNKNIFLIETHTQTKQAADHILTMNLGIAHAILSKKIEFIILTGDLDIAPEPICVMTEAGRYCQHISYGDNFRQFVRSISTGYYKRKTYFDPKIRTIEEYMYDDGESLAGRTIQLIDGRKYVNKIGQFVRFGRSSSIVLIDGEEVYISSKRNIRLQL